MELLVLPLLALALPAGVLASSQYQLALDAGVPFPAHNYHMSSAPASSWSLPLVPLQNFTTSQCQCTVRCLSDPLCFSLSHSLEGECQLFAVRGAPTDTIDTTDITSTIGTDGPNTQQVVTDILTVRIRDKMARLGDFCFSSEECQFVVEGSECVGGLCHCPASTAPAPELEPTACLVLAAASGTKTASGTDSQTTTVDSATADAATGQTAVEEPLVAEEQGTAELSTTDQPTTTGETSSAATTTTVLPTTTAPPATTSERPTTTTTGPPTTTVSSATTAGPPTTTAGSPTTTAGPPTTTAGPPTTTAGSPTTTTAQLTTTGSPTTTAELLTTSTPPTTKSPTTTKPPTTTKSPATTTESPATTTESPATTTESPTTNAQPTTTTERLGVK